MWMTQYYNQNVTVSQFAEITQWQFCFLLYTFVVLCKTNIHEDILEKSTGECILSNYNVDDLHFHLWTHLEAFIFKLDETSNFILIDK